MGPRDSNQTRRAGGCGPGRCFGRAIVLVQRSPNPLPVSRLLDRRQRFLIENLLQVVQRSRGRVVDEIFFANGAIRRVVDQVLVHVLVSVVLEPLHGDGPVPVEKFVVGCVPGGDSSAEAGRKVLLVDRQNFVFGRFPPEGLQEVHVFLGMGQSSGVGFLLGGPERLRVLSVAEKAPGARFQEGELKIGIREPIGVGVVPVVKGHESVNALPEVHFGLFGEDALPF